MDVPGVVGVTEIVAEPSPLSTSVSPAGSVPCTVSDATGNPSARTVNDPASPSRKPASAGVTNAVGASR